MATEEVGTRAITLEESINLPNIGYASIPLQIRGGSVVHAFFLEPSSLQLICKAQKGWSTKHRCYAHAKSML